mmetsp:Transcript_59375/g.173677  ORF Transcript_59375/g.173677 Transcript_59375/m.173677 type:complete len:384 (-) Transcript_59375:94-1245(-)
MYKPASAKTGWQVAGCQTTPPSRGVLLVLLVLECGLRIPNEPVPDAGRDAPQPRQRLRRVLHGCGEDARVLADRGRCVRHGAAVPLHSFQHEGAIALEVLACREERLWVAAHGGEHQPPVALQALRGEAEARRRLAHRLLHELQAVPQALRGVPQHALAAPAAPDGREHHLAVGLQLLGRVLQRLAVARHGRAHHRAVAPRRAQRVPQGHARLRDGGEDHGGIAAERVGGVAQRVAVGVHGREDHVPVGLQGVVEVLELCPAFPERANRRRPRGVQADEGDLRQRGAGGQELLQQLLVGERPALEEELLALPGGALHLLDRRLGSLHAGGAADLDRAERLSGEAANDSQIQQGLLSSSARCDHGVYEATARRRPRLPGGPRER